MNSSHMVTLMLYMFVILLLSRPGTSNISGGVYCGLSRPTESEAFQKGAPASLPNFHRCSHQDVPWTDVTVQSLHRLLQHPTKRNARNQ